MRVSRIQELLEGRSPAWLVNVVPMLVQLLADGFPLVLGGWISLQILTAFAGRMAYPYDLEWMEGGMLAHAWRVQQWYPLYIEPDADWIPYLYPPGYPALLAGLGSVFGLSAGLGRAVSVLSTLATCGALVFGCWRHGRSVGAGVLAAMVFLALYPDTGAFYDLVRPDALGVALFAWSVVLGIDADRRARIASGLLLALAFSVKHNLAAYGLPMALGIAVRFGVVEGLVFVGASAVPALLFTGIMQASSDGHFLTTLLGIARAHPMVGGRFFPGAIEELGKHVGIGAVGGSIALTAGTAWLARGWDRVGVVATAVLVGGAAIAVGLDIAPAARMPQPGTYVESTAWGSIGLAYGAVLAASCLLPKGLGRLGTPIGTVVGMGLGWWLLGPYPHYAWGWAGVAFGACCGLTVAAFQKELDGRWLYGVGICAMALWTAGLMRAHHGGFLNVYIPMHFAASLGLGLGLAISRSLWPRVEVYVLGAAVVAGQLYTHREFDPHRYMPTEADVEAGDTFVAALEQCEGPVLSPFAPWLPVLAGHEPSWHLIAIWDIDHKTGPYKTSVASVKAAAQAHHWDCIVQGNGRPLAYQISKNYGVWKTPRVEFAERKGGGPATFMPRTGWRVRPQRILVPIEAGAPE